MDRWHGSLSSGSDFLFANLQIEGSFLLSEQEIANPTNLRSDVFSFLFFFCLFVSRADEARGKKNALLP